MPRMADLKLRDVEEHDLGLTWVVDEPMRRASHALVDDGRVWFVDPVDAAEPVERALALGEPAGVLQLLDRHNRDCEGLAKRLGVPHLLLPTTVPDSPFAVVEVVRMPRWQELALWWPQRAALVVSEAVGTGPWFAPGDAAAGVHLFLRLRPPGALRRYSPSHLLVGHGSPIHGPAAAAALDEAYRRSLRDLPGLLVRLPFSLRNPPR